MGLNIDRRGAEWVPACCFLSWPLSDQIHHAAFIADANGDRNLFKFYGTAIDAPDMGYRNDIGFVYTDK
jgi:hypothetical protein